MHEYGLVQNLLDQAAAVARKNGATGVLRLELAVGENAGVEVPLLVTAYETFRMGTPCANAELAVRTVAARWECPRCGAEIARGLALRCTDCDVPARLVAGEELVLERLELEIP